MNAVTPSKPAPLLARHVDRYAAFALRYRWLLLLVGCLSFVPLAYVQSGLSMNRSLASMFALDDPVLLDYQKLQSTFGGNLVVMIVYDDDQLMTAEGLTRSREWTQTAERIQGVEGVLSVAKLVDAFAFIRPQLSLSMLFTDRDPRVALFNADDPVATNFRDLFAGYTHSPDETSGAIVVMLRSDAESEPGGVAETVQRLRQMTAELPPANLAAIVGEPVLLEDAFDLILADGRRLAIGTIGLLCLVILITLRDLRVVLLSAICIVWSNVATRAMMVMMGIELSLVSAILLALVSVIAIAAIMHIAVRCRERVTAGIALLGIPIACTCLTDAAGFAALMISEVRPVVEFGIMTATAAGCVLVSLVLFSGALMSLPERLRWKFARPLSISTTGFHHRVLARAARHSVRYRVGLSIGSILVLLASFGYVIRLETNASFLDNFRGDSPIVQVYSRVEQRLGGAGVWDIVLPAPATITPEYLQRVRDLEERLRQIEVQESGASGDSSSGPRTVRLSKVLSLADADAVASQVTMLWFVSPEVRLAGMRAAIPTFAQALLTFPTASFAKANSPHDASGGSTAPRQLRIMIRSEESLSGATKAALMSQVRKEVEAAAIGIETKAPNETKAPSETGRSQESFVTGYSVLMSHLVASLIRDQWKALAVALLAVGSLIWIVTRSLKLTIAALIVNTLPILVVLSLMGLFGGQLDLGSAMIGAVSIGLSIDGSIHFLSGYQRRRATDGSAIDSAIDSATDLGTPILLASGALVIGFAILITSPFVPTATFGLLVAATLGLSAIANLTLLPAMVAWVDS